MAQFSQHRLPNVSLGFRVEWEFGRGWRSSNSTFRSDDDRSMSARNPYRDLTVQAFEDHFDWGCRVAGPLISFFSTWDRAMNWCRHFDDRAPKVIVVWLENLEVYDAVPIVRALNYPEERHAYHKGEILVHGGIDADSYRILAMFNHRPGSLVPLGFSLLDYKVDVNVPTGLAEYADEVEAAPADARIEDPRLTPATRALYRKMYSCTGTRNDFKLYCLVLNMGVGAREGYSAGRRENGEMTLAVASAGRRWFWFFKPG